MMRSPQARAVILAAGLSTRMGAQKLLMHFRGRPLIEYAIAAARRWRPVLVAGHEVADALRDRDDITLVVNAQPQRGMAHSLALGDEAISPGDALVVLLGDKPLVSERLIAELCAALGSADVAYPVHARNGAPGHPVVFAASARRRIASLPDGDTLAVLRDDPSLVRVAVPSEDEGGFFDVDISGELAH
ncbi:MAG: nucleotidyltransferase family protein [Candidatus Cybelea sp.]|jgi:molybdenum cofactor cytidylyltransferase